MVERIAIDVLEGWSGLRGPVLRYGFLDRVHRSATRRGLAVLAFGLGRREVRLVVEGAPEEVPNLLRGVKVGSIRAARSAGVSLVLGVPLRWPVIPAGLEEAVAWAHRAPLGPTVPGPLASPWSSHRDLLGYRVAGFYDAGVLEGRVSASRVHALARGLAHPRRGAPDIAPLPLLLRVAGAVRGLLPADRRCFRLFVHLARARGWANPEIADALALTRRRIRQLAVGRDPLVGVAVSTLADPRLCRVP